MLELNLQDTEWPFTYIDHDREIVRAIVIDEQEDFYFVRVERDDDFGRATLIETSGGGVEPGEALEAALRRELKEELGVEVHILDALGIVHDAYNLIHRHNINHYYLCRIEALGETNRTQDEINDFHLATLKLDYDSAVAEYTRCATTPLGRLIANREVPILLQARQRLEELSTER